MERTRNDGEKNAQAVEIQSQILINIDKALEQSDLVAVQALAASYALIKGTFTGSAPPRSSTAR